MMMRGAGTAFSRKSYRLSLGPEKSKLPGTGLHRLCRRRTAVDRAVPVASGHPTAQPDLVWEPQGNPTDVAGRNGYPASQPGSRADVQGDRMGPQRAKYKAKAEIGKSSQRSREVLKEILKELDKAAHEMDRETVEKEAFQDGDSHTVPVTDEKTGAVQSTGVPVAVLSSPGEAHHMRRYDFFPKNPGADGKRNTNAMDPQDFRYYCIEGAVAVLGSVLFGMILCCVIRLWWKRRRLCCGLSRVQIQDPAGCANLSPWSGSCRLRQSLAKGRNAPRSEGEKHRCVLLRLPI
ncbi:uncharacterized protein [Haliaeetus albicilla]|uniref:uncharacterized protein isoform X3 n=1 Tax=Haliaeetus albicilla TaxID=8969 RepID=UPI0037E9826C